MASNPTACSSNVCSSNIVKYPRRKLRQLNLLNNSNSAPYRLEDHASLIGLERKVDSIRLTDGAIRSFIVWLGFTRQKTAKMDCSRSWQSIQYSLVVFFSRWKTSWCKAPSQQLIANRRALHVHAACSPPPVASFKYNRMAIFPDTYKGSGWPSPADAALAKHMHPLNR